MITVDQLRQAITGTPLRITVVGDLILDRYVDGRTDRLSPEAPVPVVAVERESLRLGGAANVAAGLAALGVATRVVGVLGDDAAGHDLTSLAAAEPLVELCATVVPDRRSTLKERIRVDGRHLLRVDREDTVALPELPEARLIDEVVAAVEGADAVIVSDYAKGVVSAPVMAALVAATAKAGISVVVDPKVTDLTRYAGAQVLSPNHHEALAATECPPDAPLDEVLRRLEKLVPGASFLVTCGADGMAWRGRDGDRLDRPALATSVADVTGAGDSVSAALALGAAAGLPIDAILDLASLMAAAAVAHPGTVAPTWSDISAVVNGPPA